MLVVLNKLSHTRRHRSKKTKEILEVAEISGGKKHLNIVISLMMQNGWSAAEGDSYIYTS